MPTYSYLCRSCNRAFEVQMSIREKETREPRCPSCGSGKVDQQLFGFSLKGSGGGAPAPGG